MSSSLDSERCKADSCLESSSMRGRQRLIAASTTKYQDRSAYAISPDFPLSRIVTANTLNCCRHSVMNTLLSLAVETGSSSPRKS
eukprot:5419533-Pyramimonas_sp.AAC.1